MMIIQEEQFDVLRKKLINQFKQTDCPVNKYFYYCGERKPETQYEGNTLIEYLSNIKERELFIWAYGQKKMIKSEVSCLLGYLDLFRIWEIDAIRSPVFLIFPESLSWLVVLGDDELDYKILKFMPKEN